MEGILKLVGAAVFIGLLASSASDAVSTPQTEWDDNVAKSIKDPAAKSISHYNSAIRRCKDDLSGVKTSAELAGLEVNFNSQAYQIQWQADQINKIDISRRVDYINSILRG